MWLGKTLNLMIFVIIQFQRSTQLEILIPQSLITFNEGRVGAARFECREDESAMQFSQLLVTETVAKPITLTVAAAVGLVKRCAGQKLWRPPFKESEEIVWVLYYQMVIWFTMIYFPYIAILQFFFIYIVFMFYYWYLTLFAQKPVAESNKETTGVVVSTFMLASLLVYIGVNVLLLVVQVRHSAWLSSPTPLQ